MSKKVKLILNIIVVLFYGVALVSFFTDFIYVWILGIGKLGSYKGYEVALNFDGMPTNLATLGPLLLIFGTFIYAIVTLIIKIARYKKAPKESKGGTFRPLLSALFFVIFPIVSMFLCLSTFDILQLNPPKRYGGYYMAAGPYLAAYFPLVGGLIFFITESGIFADKAPAKTSEAPKKVEAKPAPAAKPARAAQTTAKTVAQPAKPAQPVQAKAASQAAKQAQPRAKPVASKPQEIKK